MDKVVNSLREAICLCGLEDGMTISFHHCLRGGDAVSVQIAEAIRSLGIRDLTVAPSSLTSGNDGLEDYIRDGTFTRFQTSGFSPALGRLLQSGGIRQVCELRTHGGRPAALKRGDIRIDVAFVAASTADRNGNCNGIGGHSAFGAMGYSLTDVRYARKVIVITDELSPYAVAPVSIGQEQVDYVVPVETIGDPAGIATGAMRPDRSPLNRRIAELTAKAIICSGHLREGAAMQTGSGKISLSVAGQIERYMMDRQISGDFTMGGITAILVRMRKEGLLRTLYDTQSFDQTAIRSLAEDPAHCEVSAEAYGQPSGQGRPHCGRTGLCHPWRDGDRRGLQRQRHHEFQQPGHQRRRRPRRYGGGGEDDRHHRSAVPREIPGDRRPRDHPDDTGTLCGCLRLSGGDRREHRRSEKPGAGGPPAGCRPAGAGYPRPAAPGGAIHRKAASAEAGRPDGGTGLLAGRDRPG